MENPWLKLPLQSPYILEIDRDQIDSFNFAKEGRSTWVVEQSIPEPFIGNPETARVVLLGLNPGHSEEDECNFRNSAFREAMLLNLRHDSQEYPFYPLNPAFEKKGAVAWWTPRTRKLQEASGLNTASFAKRLMVIEWFPYHSKSSAFPARRICASQEYSFQLAKTMLSKKAVVVRMRSKRHWAEVDPELGELPSLKNPQCSFVTPGNMQAELFDRMVEALRSED